MPNDLMLTPAWGWLSAIRTGGGLTIQVGPTGCHEGDNFASYLVNLGDDEVRQLMDWLEANYKREGV